MSNEREEFYQPLKWIDYDIAGNKFRAYYDMDDKLVFVIDFVVNETKPNVLLVINPVGDRKWDDILMNDYGIDLETVRPKKDNKYQKLDIEYTGLAEYDALVQAYEDDEDLSDAISGLESFRHMAAMRAALERMAAAELTASRARETIEKTNETLQDLQDKLKTLRSKLAAQRREIGKEPTKQSAAKILRTESQIDSVNEKLVRAKKRHANAQHRLSQAIDESEVAREIMDVLEDMDTSAKLPAEPMETSVATVKPAADDVLVIRPGTTDVAVVEEAPVPMTQEPQFTEIVPYDEEDDEYDDDEYDDEEYEDDSDEEVTESEEVKPLFDEDPKILDEVGAFQPIDFGGGVSDVAPMINTAPVVKEKSDDTNLSVQPLTFMPPVESEHIESKQEFVPVATPMLDSLTAVQPTDDDNKIDSELMATIEPVVVPATTEDMVRPESPVVEAEVGAEESKNETTMPEIEVASEDSGFRPLSPIASDNGKTSENAVVAAPAATSQRKPTMLYYVLLIVLIVLSVFTLWLYQSSVNDSVPELGAKTTVVETVEKEDVTETPSAKDVAEEVAVAEVVVTDENPFLDDMIVAEEKEEQKEESSQVLPMPMDIVQMAVESKSESKEVAVETEAAEEPAVVVEESVAEVVVPAEEVVATVDEAPVVAEEVSVSEEAVVVPSEEEVLASKPEYGVNREEALFVADSEYETDEPATGTAIDPIMVAEPEVEEEVLLEEVPLCEDGSEPDADGCCGDEVLMDVEGRMACCSETSGDCFDPLI